jgi:hypothetical protein
VLHFTIRYQLSNFPGLSKAESVDEVSVTNDENSDNLSSEMNSKRSTNKVHKVSLLKSFFLQIYHMMKMEN